MYPTVLHNHTSSLIDVNTTFVIHPDMPSIYVRTPHALNDHLQMDDGGEAEMVEPSGENVGWLGSISYWKVASRTISVMAVAAFFPARN